MPLHRRSLLLGFGASAVAAPIAAQDSTTGPIVIAGVQWRGTKAQLFLSDHTYSRYDLAAGKIEDGYPKPVDERTWPGLASHAPAIVAACNWPDDKLQFFLRDGTFVRYDVAADRAEPGYPRPIDEGSWPGLGPYAREIRATLNWKDDKLQVFLKDGRYIRYDVAQDRADPGYPQPVDDRTWPGLAGFKGQFGGMLSLGGKAYVFLPDGRVIRYDIGADRIDPGYPRAL